MLLQVARRIRVADAMVRRLRRSWDALDAQCTRAPPTAENIGGGSAFAAGLIDRLAAGRARGEDGATLWIEAAHRGDLLAALCQETLGDFSTVQSQSFQPQRRRSSDAPRPAERLTRTTRRWRGSEVAKITA